MPAAGSVALDVPERMVTLAGEVDYFVVQPITDERVEQLRTTGTITVDVSAVTFLDSSAIRLLVRLLKVAGKVIVIGADRRIQDLLRITGLASLFDVRPAL